MVSPSGQVGVHYPKPGYGYTPLPSLRCRAASPLLVNDPIFRVLDLTDEDTAALLRELDDLIDGDRYFMSQRIKTLKAIRAKIRPESMREPLSTPPKQYAPPRATAKQRRRAGR